MEKMKIFEVEDAGKKIHTFALSENEVMVSKHYKDKKDVKITDETEQYPISIKELETILQHHSKYNSVQIGLIIKLLEHHYAGIKD